VDDDDYRTFRDRVFTAFWEELTPLVDEIESDGRIPHERVWAALQTADALGLLVPPAYGGHGLTIIQYLPITAELAKVHGGIRVLAHVHNSFAHAIAELGTEAQRAELLPSVARGELSLAFALTEPDRGSGADVGTIARTDGSEYVIDGRKWLITNSNFASHFIVVARTSEERGRELSLLLVERDAPGLAIAPLPDTMGCRGGEHGELTFRGVRVPCESVLGGVAGRGQEQLKRALDVSRLFIAASSWGVAEYTLSLAVARARTRVTFGRPIAERKPFSATSPRWPPTSTPSAACSPTRPPRRTSANRSLPRPRSASCSGSRLSPASPTARYWSSAASGTRAPRRSSVCTAMHASTGSRRARRRSST
jgi:alkylation response protein AidB-like acyl-CoA dehydrogenase